MDITAIYELMLVVSSMLLVITLFFRFSKKQELEKDDFKPPPPPFPKFEEGEKDKEVVGHSVSKVWIKSKPKEEEKFKVRVRDKDLDNLFDDFGIPKEESREEGKIEVKKDRKEIIKIKSLHRLDEHDREEATEEISHAIKDVKEAKKPQKRRFSFFESKTKEKSIKEKSKRVFHSKLEDDVEVIKSDINKARTQLMNFNLKGAKKTYISIMKLYNHLTSEDKSKVYDLIKDLYDERKNAETLMIK